MNKPITILAPIITFAFSFWAGAVQKWEPFHTYLYFFAWGPFLWLSYQLLMTKYCEHPLKNKKHFLLLFPFSTTLWLVFEVFNFRLKNWSYHGIPHETWIRWPGYALSFATVVPAILILADLLDSKRGRGLGEGGHSSSQWPFFVGFLMLCLSLVFPQIFFALVWGSLFFLLEPFVQKAGGHSLFQDWREKQFGRTKALLFSGLLCGIFWEMCNFWAGAKWQYHIPLVGFLKIFEMPVLGFIGFPAFALEVHVCYEAFSYFWDTRLAADKFKFLKKLLFVVMTFFWLAAFWGIDVFTVKDWR